MSGFATVEAAIAATDQQRAGNGPFKIKIRASSMESHRVSFYTGFVGNFTIISFDFMEIWEPFLAWLTIGTVAARLGEFWAKIKLLDVEI